MLMEIEIDIEIGVWLIVRWLRSACSSLSARRATGTRLPLPKSSRKIPSVFCLYHFYWTPFAMPIEAQFMVPVPFGRQEMPALRNRRNSFTRAHSIATINCPTRWIPRHIVKRKKKKKKKKEIERNGMEWEFEKTGVDFVNEANDSAFRKIITQLRNRFSILWKQIGWFVKLVR